MADSTENFNHNKSGEHVENADVKSKRKPFGQFASCYKVLLIVAILFAAALVPVVNMLGIYAMLLATPVAAITMIILFCRGVASLRRIKKGGQLPLDRDYAWPSIIVSVVILFCLSVFWPGFSIGFSKMLMGSYSGAGEIKSQFKEYAKSHDGKLPEAENWCDEFRNLDKDEEYDNFMFGRSERQIGFGINKSAAKLRENVPDDMVLFFECEAGWNVSGSPELAKGRWDDSIVWIVFGDLSSKKFRQKDVKYLRWKLEDDGVIPQEDKTVTYAGFFISVGILLLGLAMRWRGAFHKYWQYVLGVGIGASLIGAGCSFWAETLYVYNNDTSFTGWIFALPAGFGVGFVYVLLVGAFVEGNDKSRNIMPFTVASGAIAGVICSCIIHGFLMIAYEETSLLNMGAGAIFGASAGVILGRVTAALMKKMFLKKLEIVNEENLV